MIYMIQCAPFMRASCTKFASYNTEYKPKVGDKLYYGPPAEITPRDLRHCIALSSCIWHKPFEKWKTVKNRNPLCLRWTIFNHIEFSVFNKQTSAVLLAVLYDILIKNSKIKYGFQNHERIHEITEPGKLQLPYNYLICNYRITKQRTWKRTCNKLTTVTSQWRHWQWRHYSAWCTHSPCSARSFCSWACWDGTTM